MVLSSRALRRRSTRRAVVRSGLIMVCVMVVSVPILCVFHPTVPQVAE
jgi:hypothetical protein